MPPSKERALYLSKRELATLVFDAVNLEGINVTLPEVQTLLEGVTIGGHTLSDQQVVLNQKNAYNLLFELVKENRFRLDKQTFCHIHEQAGYQDALAWGEFRKDDVRIAGTDYRPPKFSQLEDCFKKMIVEAEKLEDIYDKAIYVFLWTARNQFFYDVNKRTGRLMMNGILLNAGYPAINLQASHKLEFNTLMLDFYNTGDVTSMNKFLRSCLKEDHIKFMKSGRDKHC